MRIFNHKQLFALVLGVGIFAANGAEQNPLAPYQAAAEKAKVIFSLPKWEKSPDDIAATVKSVIAAGDADMDAIAALKPEAMTFANTFGALDQAHYKVGLASERLSVIQETALTEEMRETARHGSKRLESWFIDSSFRQDVYQAIKTFAATNPKVSGEDAMLMKTVLRDYRRNGMELAPEKRTELQRLKTALKDLGLEFAKNINNADSYLEFSREELAGASDDFLNNKELLTADGKYRINANVTWQVLEILQNVKNEAVRKRLSIARSSRALDVNTPIFIKMLKIRARIAQLLGYANWADYRIEPKMAKNGKTAQDFLLRLNKGLQPKFDAEMARFRALKIKETGNKDAQIRYWDIPYYVNQLKKTGYQIDSEKLKVYFELERTLKGMFSIFEELFSIKITPLEAPYKWVDDLRLYAVTDSRDDTPLGLIYMDLFPRKGKYNHFAQFGITTGKRLPENGYYQRPVVALICNFPPGANGKPSLLTHDHVETLFHEFGHALHSVLTQANYAEFSGTSVPRDFVEAPSQMLENWVRDKDTLDRFAIDYRDDKSKIPADILDKMEAARLATIGTHYRRQLGFGLLDLAIHMTTDEKVFDNVVEVTNKIMSETYVPVPEHSGLIASFGHLGGGYDAGYYGYAWADAIAADMADVFRKSPGGFMDKKTGMRLRNEIYAPGGSREIEESIHAFLQRDRSLEPFFEFIGMKKDK